MRTATDSEPYFLVLVDPEKGDIITPLDLPTLTYITNKLTLILCLIKCPLFNEEMNAWDLGYVAFDLKTIKKFYTLYSAVKDYSNSSLLHFLRKQMSLQAGWVDPPSPFDNFKWPNWERKSV